MSAGAFRSHAEALAAAAHRWPAGRGQVPPFSLSSLLSLPHLGAGGRSCPPPPAGVQQAAELTAAPQPPCPNSPEAARAQAAGAPAGPTVGPEALVLLRPNLERLTFGCRRRQARRWLCSCGAARHFAWELSAAFPDSGICFWDPKVSTSGAC